MRVPTSAIYSNFTYRSQAVTQKLYTTNTQISSGELIQYGYEDTNVFTNSLRLQDELNNQTQVKKAAQNALSFSNSTDTILSDMGTQLDRFKQLLLQSANDTNSTTNYQAIAAEMTSIRSHLINLANTSVNGQYLFAGTALSQKPVDSEGTYQGNGGAIEVFGGSNIRYTQNIDGQSLFLGEDSDYHRQVTTNVRLLNQTKLDPTQTNPTVSTAITPTDTIADMTGTSTGPTYFYIDGRSGDGTSFKTRVTMSATATVQDLLDQIGHVYGDNVSVSMTSQGEIEIRDNHAGSSLLQFHMVGADQAVTDLSTLPAGSKVTEFVKSGFALSSGSTGQEGLYADTVGFAQNGAVLTSNVPQIVKSTNTVATASTRLKDVAGGATLSGSSMTMEVTDVSGTARTLTMSFAAGGVTVSGAGTGADPFTVWDASGAATAPDNMTYGQLMDVLKMAVSGSFPAADTPAAYGTAVQSAGTKVSVGFDQRGAIQVTDLSTSTTKARLAMFDSSAYGGFNAFVSASTMSAGTTLSFASNNAVTIDDPKISFFNQLQEAIDAVKNGLTRPDASSSVPRNGGIQAALTMIDHLSDHIERKHTENGAISNAITSTQDRAESLITNITTLKSGYLDTDVAQATLDLSKYTLTYQAMMAAISKVNNLSLVNYM